MFNINTHGTHEGLHTLERWTVNLTTGALGQQRLDDHSQEFPRIDERRVGKPHRYGYSLSLREQQAQHPVALLKHDLNTNKTITQEFGANREPGEFIFEPNTANSSEDDGVLMDSSMTTAPTAATSYSSTRPPWTRSPPCTYPYASLSKCSTPLNELGCLTWVRRSPCS
jgi:carotenoid cleavage dioxygenase-like enzyme